MFMVFLLNGFGIIDPAIPAKEMMERGAPAALVPLAMLAGFSKSSRALTRSRPIPSMVRAGIACLPVTATCNLYSFWLPPAPSVPRT
jgi:hypothetical protein